ncbi:resolvase [Clostridium botulinum]|uniref:Uncharacterized protein n=1 Tax=Clostridium botulinum (strain Okra / Type B1) TaxID=498213 RepID=B1IMR4_CLOBK|nr:hypothetical protein [Clostridium botulinum]EKX79274.1 hypothetical protein CFSAN001628_013928 [Clostridium botulinum CFSAN001628]ACA45956.1 hypothetical protein CLD_2726 [Clostridium botulinum B1 str. Okra]AUN01501.1 resolvase [Clostridium botulinum]AUN03384.1 resolvase [Clostridium botulinum]EDT83664.1 hypothetical protein CBB_N0007 [Clostridium botulinum Bf]
MDDSKNIYISIIIFISIVIARILVNELQDKYILIIMSSINVIALAVVLIIIPYNTYRKMENTQIELGKQYNDEVPINSHMKKFKSKFRIYTIIIMILMLIYLIYFRSSLCNDIFSILALVLSINDDAFINKLFEYNYKSYYGNEMDEYLNNFK